MHVENTEMDGYTLLENVSLNARNTLRVAARARWLAEVHDPQALPKLLATPALQQLPVLVLGEGSNVLFTTDYPGLVVQIATRGVEVRDTNNQTTQLHAAAGEHWDDLVRWSLSHGYPGLENLILIPGSVGAAPIQNIGAYGVEVAEYIHSVEAFDRQTEQAVELSGAACEFGYRDSCFKQQPDRWIVTAVNLNLLHEPGLHLEYAGLRTQLARMGVSQPAPYHIAEAVLQLRTRKLPDPTLIGNAGSFFKNPLLPTQQAHELQAEHPQIVLWPVAEECMKISAAWMIDACGFKGLREGDAGISNRHALVLVNHGKASGAELWALAQRVREGVQQRFGIWLEPEPRIL